MILVQEKMEAAIKGRIFWFKLQFTTICTICNLIEWSSYQVALYIMRLCVFCSLLIMAVC